MTKVATTDDLAREAAIVQVALHDPVKPLAARDASIAGAAKGLEERLAAADSGFAVEGLAEPIEIYRS